MVVAWGFYFARPTDHGQSNERPAILLSPSASRQIVLFFTPYRVHTLSARGGGRGEVSTTDNNDEDDDNEEAREEVTIAAMPSEIVVIVILVVVE